jgi:hypothetical protein
VSHPAPFFKLFNLYPPEGRIPASTATTRARPRRKKEAVVALLLIKKHNLILASNSHISGE